MREVQRDIGELEVLWGLVKEFLTSVREVGEEYWSSVLHVPVSKIQDVYRSKKKTRIFSFVDENASQIERGLNELKSNAERAKEIVYDLVYRGVKWVEIARAIGKSDIAAKRKIEGFLKRRYVTSEELDSLLFLQKKSEQNEGSIDIGSVEGSLIGFHDFLDLILYLELFNERSVDSKKVSEIVMYFLKGLKEKTGMSFRMCLSVFLHFVESFYGADVKDEIWSILKVVKGGEIRELLEREGSQIEGDGKNREDAFVLKRAHVYFVSQFEILNKLNRRIQEKIDVFVGNKDKENLINLSLVDLLRVIKRIKQIEIRQM